MTNEITQLYTTFTTGFAIIVDAGLPRGCLGLPVASSPFFVVDRWPRSGSSASSWPRPSGNTPRFSLRRTSTTVYAYDLGADILALISTVVLVLGLGVALADIRHKLAVSMEPKHVRT